MLRDSKFSRRNSSKNPSFEEPENVPVNVSLREPSLPRLPTESYPRPPLNAIQEPQQNPSKPDQESGFKSSKACRTPTKAKGRHPESGMAMRTPEKQGTLCRNRYGWGQDSRDEGRIGNVNTPKSSRALGRTVSGFSDVNSAHSTPTKSVTKPTNPGLVYGGNSRPPTNGGARTGNFTALSKGIPLSSNACSTMNAIEVPHFELREDPSFWMDHNVQVLIRIRPLNDMEIGTQGYSRCLKQESAQCLTWVGHPETRFTFDHVACETINQETLFKMVGLPMVENCLSGYNSCMFAYGQTGSGKTHTMLGEINDLEVKPSPYRGMTPRIFEFLFTRIIAEEESRRDDKLTYNCKCSFLEIYNEQITDLLDPSSTNLQLREDVKKGVYVENLSEFEVHTVGDILKLLSQGSSNRRVAATNMNRESSRSHSVFTCVIESRWEKDSTSNLRFARLNLVDLAGSERQKTSGAEGERLKEAASINKSLSTLGHVIMVLVDGANSRTRHVPYRDSRLTFLLQDSLGGNSKTMIIANVSPATSSATETLNTLKFAQRAKLIQNNAVINEDASGDVMALQHQIRLLKEELAILKRHHTSRSLTFSSRYIEATRQEHEDCSNTSSFENMFGDDDKVLRVSCKQLKSLETSLNGALRREQSTENSIKQLEEEIEQLNCLVRQREEENRCTKMMLKFREDKIQRMESLLAGSILADSYLLEENNTLREEIGILRAKVDRNPEVTRFAVENIRLLEQLRRFQDFYEEGEREMLMTEVSELRDQLVLFLDENSKQGNQMNSSIEKETSEDKIEDDSLQSELKKSQEELEKCRDDLNSFMEKNSKLCREIADLNALLEMQKFTGHDQDGGIEVIKESILESSSICDHPSHAVQKDESLSKDTEGLVDLQLEVEILKIILLEESSTRGEIEEKALCLSRELNSTEEKFLLITNQCENLREELQEAKSVIEALEVQQLVSIKELEELKNTNKQYAEILHEKELKMTYLSDQILSQASRDLQQSSNHLENEDIPLKAKLNKVQESLSKAKRLNMWYQTDRACHASNEEEMDEVRRQVESETAEVIVCLQEELSSFQQQMHENSLKERDTQQELTFLQEKYEEKDRKLSSLTEELGLLTNNIEEVLTAGHEVLDDALNQLGPGKRTWVSEQLQVIARNISEKELRIEELNSCLEDAKSRGNEMECMLRSLRGATLVMSEAHQQDCSKKDQEIEQLLSQLSEQDATIKQKEEQNRAMSVCATAAFVVVNRLSEIKYGCLEALTQKEAELDKLTEILMAKDSLIHSQGVAIDDAEKQIQSLKLEPETEAHNCEKVTEVAKLHSEKEFQFSEKQNPKSIEFIVTQVLGLQVVIDNFEEQVGAAIVSLDCRLQTVEELLQQCQESCFQERKLYELELTEAKQHAVQQAVESSCYIDKFVETQHKFKEADFMIYKLVTANKAMETDIAELKGKEVIVTNERDMLKDSYSLLEKQLHTDTMGMKREIEELERTILQIQATVDEDLMATASDFFGIKSHFYDSSNLMRSWCEDIWSEIVSKDWAVSLLHACHMGILMETVTGMNAENSMLYDGLCEPDSLESHLKDHNGKSRREVEACSMLREQIQDLQLSIKVTSFEEKIQDLQLLEEGMLVSSSSMGHDLSLIPKEIDISHQKQQVINNKDEDLEEKLVMEFLAKEIELFIMSSILEQMASEINDLEKEKISMSMVIEKFKQEMIISCVEKDWILQEKDAEVVLMQKEALDISSTCCSALEQSASEKNDLERENVSMSMVLEKLKEDIIISYVEKDWILQEKDAEVLLLQKEALEISSTCCSALEQTASEKNDLEREKISMSMVLEKLKEDIIVSCVGKDWILQEKDVEISLLQKEALKISSNCSSAIKQMASENNDLERENISMSMVLEKFKEEMIISCVEKDWILQEKDAEVGLLQKEALEISSNYCSALEQIASENYYLEREKISMSMVLEKFKEDLIISRVENDWILQEKDAELGLLQKALDTSSHYCSDLAQMASENNDLEREKVSMSMALQKFKEDMIISCVEKDLILQEKDAEIGLLQKEALEISSNCCSALEQMASVNNNLEKEKFSMSIVLEKFKEDTIISCVEKDWILQEKDAEVGLLQKEALEISSNCCSALEQMASENNILEKEKGSMSIVLEKFKEDMIISCVEKDWILQEKDAEVGLLHKEALGISSNYCSDLEQMALVNNNLEKEKIAMSMVFEKFKEDMIISYVEKDWILQEKDAEVGLLQKEALEISSNCCSALEQMASENNILEKEKGSMSIVLEKFKEDMIISCVEKDWILQEKDAEVGLLHKEALGISSNYCSDLEQMALVNNNLEKEKIAMSMVFEKFKEDTIISYVEKDWILQEKDAEVGLLQKEALEISSNCCSALEQMASENNILEKEKFSMSMVLEKFKEDTIISCVEKDWILQEQDAKVGLLQNEALEISSNYCSAIEQMASENNDLEKENISMSMVLEKFKEEMIISCMEKEWILQERDAEVGLLQKEALDISSKYCSALEQMASENNDLEKEKIHMSMVFEKFKEDMIVSCVEKDWTLQEKDAEVGLLQKEALDISSKYCSALEQMTSENNDLEREKISMSMVLEKYKEDLIISSVDMQLKDWILLEKDAEVGLLQKEALKISYNHSSTLERMASENNDLEKEKISLSKALEKFKEEMIIMHVGMQLKDWILLEADAEIGLLHKKVELLEEDLKISSNCCSALEQITLDKNDLQEEKIILSTVLEKFKEDMIISCVDMQLKDWIFMEKDAEVGLLQKEVVELEASIEALEYDLYEHVVKGQVLEAELKEKVASIFTLEADFRRECECIKSLSSEIHLLTKIVKDALKAKELISEQLAEIMKAKESLEMEILELETALDKKNSLIKSLKGDLETVHIELRRSRKEVEMAQALAEEHEAVAMEAKQGNEMSRRYAEEKEEELKLYEKSVEELEFTVNVLENQVDIIKGDAERQRLQREEIELELHGLKQQIHTVKSSDFDMRRHLEEKEKSLQDVLQHIKVLEKDIASKDAEIAQHKDHITELNLHAEAQAREYKQTFKALGAMADEVKPDGASNSPSKKLERLGSRSRGSGSPFKCIGLGLAQQVKAERDEELTAARVRIEELEALAATKQKEIFTLNTKLAMSGSMTHDVLRDLLGIKSDMTTYSQSIMDDNQDEEVPNADPQVKEQEVMKQKLEQLTSREDMLKKKVMELEAEVKKLSEQQNLQQRIHHHAKIKEENNALKAEKDEISDKLSRSEAMVTRIKKELASFRTANPC